MSKFKISRRSGEHTVAKWVRVKFGPSSISKFHILKNQLSILGCDNLTHTHSFLGFDYWIPLPKDLYFWEPPATVTISLEDFGLKFACQNLIHQHNDNIWWSFQRPKQPNHKLNDGCRDHFRGTVFFQSSTRIFEPFWDSIYRFFSDPFFEIPELLSTSGWLYIYIYVLNKTSGSCVQHILFFFQLTWEHFPAPRRLARMVPRLGSVSWHTHGFFSINQSVYLLVI